MAEPFWEAFEPYVRTILFAIVFGGIPLYAFIISCRLYPRIFETTFPASPAPQRRSGRSSEVAEDSDTEISLVPRLENLGDDDKPAMVRPKVSDGGKSAADRNKKVGSVDR